MPLDGRPVSPVEGGGTVVVQTQGVSVGGLPSALPNPERALRAQQRSREAAPLNAPGANLPASTRGDAGLQSVPDRAS